MAKTKHVNKKATNTKTEQDGVYFLKLVLFFIVGCLWIHIGKGDGVSLPVGLILGLLLASHEHFQIDRKVEYAVLLIATILSFIAPIGFVLTIG